MRGEAKIAENIVEARDLHMYFTVSSFGRKYVVKAVDGVTLEFKRGETVGVVGESGSGKSTLGRTLLRLYKPTKGRIKFMGRDITDLPEKKLRPLRRYMQLVPQDPYAAFNPRRRVGDSIREVLEAHNIARGEEAREHVYRMLEAVGLTPPQDFYERYPYQLSGGQLQRAAIARAMIVKPVFVVADEPTSSLDVSVRAGIIDLLLEFKEKLNQTVMFITHDIATAKLVADRIAVMYLGKIVEIGPTQKLVEEPLHPYTKALIDAVPRLYGKPAKIVRLKGEIADPRNPPRGCRLHPRCPFAKPECSRREPPLAEVERGRMVACWLYSGK